MPARLLATFTRVLPGSRWNLLWLALAVTTGAVTIAAVLSLSLNTQAGSEGRQAGSFSLDLEAADIQSVVVLDWDTGSVDWNNITDESTVGQVQFRDAATLETVATIETGYDPQLAISGDGSRLFIAETVSVDLAPVQRLRVFDLTNGPAELAVISLQDRVLTTADVAPGTVATSVDGRYVFVEGYLGDSYWVDAYDVDSGGAAVARVDLPDMCGLATILPTSAEAQFVAVCKGPAASVTIAEPSIGVSTTLEIEGVSQFINGVPIGGLPSRIASAVISGDGLTAYVLGQEGLLRIIDVAGGTHGVQQLDLAGRAALPDQIAVVGDVLYIGTGEGADVGDGRSTSLLAFDIDTFSLRGATDSPLSFSSFSVSRDDALIYVVDRRSRQLAVLDSETGSQLTIVENIGGVPDFIALR